jgi:hypothetical protein
MKKLITLLILFNLLGCSKDVNIEDINIKPLTPHSFNDVWSEVYSDLYKTLPQDKISYGKLFTHSKNIILHDAKRTLLERADILEPFDKLAHPNGACMKGYWNITQANPYSGYFKNGSKALIIARASSAMSNTKRNETRAFGMAGKLFPTTDENKINKEPTANFFVIDDLGGTKALHYTDVTLTNEPDVTTTTEVLKNLLYALKVSKAFEKADTNPTIRQLYEISELGEGKSKNIITPKWMSIKAKSGQTIDAEDFRDEFRLEKGQKLVFEIAVASKEVNGKKNWKTIGDITFDDSLVSYSCDHRLHFHHPKWRDDLRYE